MRLAGKVLAFLGSAIVALVVALVLAGVSQSGVVNMRITHTLFWLAFGTSAVAMTLGTWLMSRSFKDALLALLSTVLIVGGGLWWLDSWLAARKAEQDAANQPPKLAYRDTPGPSVPVIKTPKPASQAPAINQHGNGNGAVGGNLTVAPCGGAQIGGIGNQQTVNCRPPERHLSEQQRAILGGLVIPEGIAITLSLSGQDKDSQTYGYEIYSACNGKIPPTGFFPIAVFSGHPPQGITVRIHDKDQLSLVQLATQIAQALNTPTFPVAGGLTENAKPNTVEIIIGPQ
jgi:hypothetical protein